MTIRRSERPTTSNATTALWTDVGFSVVLVLLAITLRFAADPILGARIPFAFFYPAIAAVGFLGSFRSTVITLTLSLLAAWYLFIPPRFAFAVENAESVFHLLTFLFTGCVVGWLVYAQGRARKRIKALSDAESLQREWLQVTLESIGDGVIATNNAGEIRFINNVATKLTGWPVNEAVGQHLSTVFKVLNEQTGEPSEDPVAKSLREKGAVTLANHTLLVARDGTKTPIADSASPIYSRAGEIEGVVLVFRTAVEERQRERLYAEAESARQQAEDANRIKDEFLSTVSHELRGPLNTIMGWAETMQRVSDRTTLERGLAIIQTNVKAQARLIDDILDIASIVAGKFRLEHETVHLPDIVFESLELFRAAAEKKHIGLHIDLDESVMPVWGDPARLLRAINNLYSNAIKFTPQGGQITTRLRQHGDELELCISDTGKGISPDFLPHLFDRFRQADSSIRRTEGGLGLGLSIVRRIVELHGGRVTATSDGINLGTAMHVWLPCDSQRLDTPGYTSDDEIVSTNFGIESHNALAGTRILVVEDDILIAEVLADALRRYGADARAVGSAKAALEKLEESRADMVISDIGLPERDGYWLMEAIRKWEALKGYEPMLAVAVTAYGRAEDKERAKQAGYNMHAEKPISPEDLAAQVNRLLRRSRTTPFNTSA